MLLLQPRLGYGEGKYLCIYIYLLRPKLIKLIKLFPKAVTETKTNIYNKYYLLGKSRNVTHESKTKAKWDGHKMAARDRIRDKGQHWECIISTSPTSIRVIG